MIFDLVRDFAGGLEGLPQEHSRWRILALLGESLRRDAHFLRRHPTTLFQCLWNTCWWYGCPEAAGHYQERQAPGGRAGARLHLLPEKWRREKDQQTPGFVWLRSLRPPEQHIGGPLKAVIRGHTSVESVSFSHDGRRIATAGPTENNYVVRVWDATSGAEIHLVKGHTSQVNDVCFSPDGRLLASVGDTTVRVWDAYSGAEVLLLQGHSYRVNCVCFSPDGLRLASASDDKTVRVWDATSATELFVLQGHRSSVKKVCFSADGPRLASAEEKAIRSWDAASGACLADHFSITPEDLIAFAAGPTIVPWHARKLGFDAVLVERSTGHHVARFPAAPTGGFTSSPSGNVWAWDVAGYIYLITLQEGDFTTKRP